MHLPTPLRYAAFFVLGSSIAISIPALAQRSVQPGFSDVSSQEYFSDAVSDLSRLGIVKGYNNGRFGPGDSITRGQAAVMIQRYDQTVVQQLREQIEELRVLANVGRCGNEKIETGEQCDDGNTTNGDGCSRWCLTEQDAVTCDGHPVGSSYIGADGCNRCTCMPGGQEACTKMYCQQPDKRCTSSNDCSEDQYCTTEDDVCMPCSNDPAAICPAVCYGLCQTKKYPEGCEPYLCADGTKVRKCTDDGTVINYFADPCLNRRCKEITCPTAPAGCSYSRPNVVNGCIQSCGELECGTCGNGICEQGEATECPACRAGQICTQLCKLGSCTRDCRDTE